MFSCGLQLRVIEGSASGQVYPLSAEQITLGRTSPGVVRSDGFVHVDDDTVSRLHAELAWNELNQCYTLVNRSETNPTRLNDSPVEQVEVRAGDRIRMGECLLILESTDPKMKRAVALTQRPPLALQVLEGSLAGQKIPVVGMILALGGPPDPAEPPQKKTVKWFDQEVVLDAELPPRFLSLTWKELLNAFELSRVDPCEVPVSVQRAAGGLSWVAQLSAGNTGLVRADDVIRVGDHQFQVTVGHPGGA